MINVSDVLVQDCVVYPCTELIIHIILIRNPVHEVCHYILQILNSILRSPEHIIPEVFRLATRIEEYKTHLLLSVTIERGSLERITYHLGGECRLFLKRIHIKDRFVPPSDCPSVVGAEARRSKFHTPFTVTWLSHIVKTRVVHYRRRSSIF